MIPATSTNAKSERTFSAPRIVKTYLRSAVPPTRLNSLITFLHVHSITERTDALDVKESANIEFTVIETRGADVSLGSFKQSSS